MKWHFTALLAALAIALSVTSGSAAQQQTGEIFGKVTDESGAILPGVSVTLTGPSLLQPLTAITSETGSFQFPRLEVGTYNVKFELAGSRHHQGGDPRDRRSRQREHSACVSAVQETVTAGATPPVDTKETD
jgi:hypothetical protein